MAKNAKPKQRKSKKTRSKAVIIRSRTLSSLDAHAAAYARLLSDPCNAPLVHGVGVSSGDAMLIRLESDAIYFDGAGITAGSIIWTPGAKVALGTSRTSDAVTTPSFVQITNGIAGEFLNSQATSYRCLAACMQVFWPGTELNRQGFIGLGLVPSSLQTQMAPTTLGGGAGVASIGQLRVTSQMVARMPQNRYEIMWKPGPGDDNDFDYASYNQNPASTPALMQNRNSILMTATGLPAAVGVRVRTVAVYEYTPVATAGLVNTVQTTRSANTTQDVVRELDQKLGDNWFLRGIRYIGMGVGAAAGAYSETRQQIKAAAQKLELEQVQSRPMIEYMD